MRVVSAFEDFLGRSVRAVNGAFERLRFLAEIRRDGNKYEHWGMTSTYGEEKANRAMSEAHTQTWLEVLRTPIDNLEKDVVRSPGAQQLGPEEYVRQLSVEEKTVPAEIAGGSKRHFSFVLKTLNLLVRRARSNHPVA